MKYKCCICGQDFEDFGNNPWPVVLDDNARCCGQCNFDKVIPARIDLMMGHNNGTEQSK